MEPKIYTLTQAVGSGPLFREQLYTAPAHDFNLVVAEPGLFKDPHPYGAGDTFMLVLKGSMELLVDGSAYRLTEGQVAFIPKGAVRGFTAGPEGFTMFAAHMRD